MIEITDYTVLKIVEMTTIMMMIKGQIKALILSMLLSA